MGFPCNQFGAQEPNSEAEILEFVTKNYDVTFPMFSKIEVNGDGAAPLYEFLLCLQLAQCPGGGHCRDRTANVLASSSRFANSRELPKRQRLAGNLS